MPSKEDWDLLMSFRNGDPEPLPPPVVIEVRQDGSGRDPHSDPAEGITQLEYALAHRPDKQSGQ